MEDDIQSTYYDSHILVRDALIEDIRANKKITVNLNDRIINKVSTEESSDGVISIVATSDIHGNVLNFDYSTNSVPSKGRGLAKVSTYVKNLREKNPNVMLVDNGDIMQGTPLVYYYNMIDKTSVYPISKVMGAMKYDTETLGNHEFNYGLDTLNRFIKDQTKIPTALMDLINKVQMEYAGTQLSIAAPLSSTAHILEGDITIKDVIGVYVFENYLYGIKMSGKQIKTWLEYSARYYKQVSDESDPIVKDPDLNVPDYNLDMLYGADYDIDLTKPVGSRIVNLKYNGKSIKDTDIFTVAINDYRYNGGGGFMKEAGISNTDPSIVTYSSAKQLGDDGQVRSLMTSYIKEKGSISPECSDNWKLYEKEVKESADSGTSSSSSSGSDSSHHHSSSSSDVDSSSNAEDNNVNKTDNVHGTETNKPAINTGSQSSDGNTWFSIDGKWYYLILIVTFQKDYIFLICREMWLLQISQK